MAAIVSSPAVYGINAAFLRMMSRRVDKLGALNAEISRLQAEAEAIKGTLRASGLDEVVGKAYRAVIVATDTVRLDSAKVKAILSPAQIAECSVTSRSVRVALYDL